MRRIVRVFLFSALIAIFGFQLHTVDAYQTYSSNGTTGNCATCHGAFDSGTYTSLADGQSWGMSLMSMHNNLILGGDCSACHSSGSRSPVYLNSSAGGSGLSPISCMGCHGRAEDDGHDGSYGGYGAGLRQHHTAAGVTVCENCHIDANPANYTPVGENVLPPYYANPGTSHPSMPTDPCNLDGNENFVGSANGLDNDGDGIYDGLDPDCLPTYTITASTPIGGIISPAGTTTVTQGDTLTFSIAPYCSEYIGDVDVDGTSVGAVSSFTFTNVTASHTISATYGNLPGTCYIGPALLVGTQNTYNTAQVAYDAIPIGGNDTIKLMSEDLGEPLVFDQDVNVTLRGGYYCWWSCPTDPPISPGPTTESSMTISNGTVIVDYIAIK